MASGTFEEIINFAKEKEEEAVQFYTDLAKNVEAENMKEALLEMAGEEQKHKEALENMSLEVFKGSEPPREIEDLKLATNMPELEPRPDMSYQEILTVAIKREEGAEKLYHHMATVAAEDIQKQVLERLSAEEAKHRNILEKAYDDYVNKEN